jgi:hypothetical protein
MVAADMAEAADTAGAEATVEEAEVMVVVMGVAAVEVITFRSRHRLRGQLRCQRRQ